MGLDYHEVKLLPYDERWDEQFQTEKSLIEANIISSGFSIEHIGSTAVPGMVAKPIIDIVIGINDINQALSYINILATLKYSSLGECGRPGRYFLVKGDPEYPEDTQFHVHLVQIGDYYWNNFILFRNCLIDNPGLAESYANVKKVLAKRYKFNRTLYRLDKSLFIDEVLEEIRLRADEPGDY